MKKIKFKTRAQWGYFRSAIIGTAIGMMIAPGIADLIREHDNNDSANKSGIKEKIQYCVDSISAAFAPGDRVKVIINGNVVAIAKNREEGEAAFKQARLDYNSDGIKSLWVDVSYEQVDKDNQEDKKLLKKMRTTKDDELVEAVTKGLDSCSQDDKKLAYTMRIDDYIVTMEKFDDVVSVLEKVQSSYDTNDDFRVCLKQPESKNVAMYEVEINEKLEDVERNVPDKIENTEETIDGVKEDESSEETSEANSDNTTEVATDNTSEAATEAPAEDSTEAATETPAEAEPETTSKVEIPQFSRTLLTGSEPDATGEENAEENATEGENSAENEETAEGENDEGDEGAKEESTEITVDESNPEVVEAEAKLSSEDGIKYVGFSDRIYVVETYVNSSEIKDKDTVYNDVTTPIDESGVYVVVPGDYLSIIAEKVGMSEDKIKELNEGIEDDGDIYYDDRLNILVSTPPVEVMVEKQETYTEKYYADVQYQDDGNMYIGETSVVQEGSPGIHTVTDLVTYKGNLESDRKHIDEVVEVSAVAQVVLRGTKSKPTYMYPVTNWNVTSNFGYRWGRLHAGTDVGVPQGTTVRASRGGQVITAGWVGGYGNCVIIDHGDGVSTRYGHLSQVLVTVGQYVDQGDQIALSGNTGRSTGPHLHFEIRINGEAVDPLPYLE